VRGRPPKLDSTGKPVTKCLVNCTIPAKLRDFLAENNVNRSELFRKAALKLYELKVCPYCYGHDVLQTDKGYKCQDCNKWLKFNRCELCNAKHTPQSYLASVDGKVGCDQCPKHIDEVDENKRLDKVFTDEVDALLNL
jgi:hypothetical protein